MSGGKGNYFRGVGNNELRNQRFEAQGSSALRSIAKAGEALQHTKQEDWALWQVYPQLYLFFSKLVCRMPNRKRVMVDVSL
jgi:hypothetical protein